MSSTPRVHGLYLAIDTTGLPPGRGSRCGEAGVDTHSAFTPRVIGIGLAVVDDAGGIVASTGTLVRQPRDHVHDPGAAGAFGANGIDPEDVVKARLSEDEAAAAMKAMIFKAADGGRPVPVHGFNVAFLRHFLDQPPWSVDRLPLAFWGHCVMRRAAEVIGAEGPEGSRGRRGPPTRIAMGKVLAWASERGYDIVVPGTASGRAEANAIRCAKIDAAQEAAKRLSGAAPQLLEFGDDEIPF